MAERNRNKIVFLSADHLEAQADARAREAALLPDGEAKESALRNAAQLRGYALMKRVVAPTNAGLNKSRG